MLVTGLAVFRKVESLALHLRRGAETDDGLHDESDDHGCHHTPDNSDQNRFDLGHEKAFLHGLNGRIGFGVSKDAGQDRTQGPSDPVHSKGVQSIVISQPIFEKSDGEKRNDPREQADENR